MNLLFSLFLLCLSGVYSITVESTEESTAKLGLEETVIYLRQRMKEMEGRVSLLENRETADMLQRTKDELLVAVQEVERKTLEEKNHLLAKMDEMEAESRSKRSDLSEKLHELREWALEQRDQVLKRVTEVENRCDESAADLSGKLQNAENRFTKVDNHLLLEVLQLKTMSVEAIERVRGVEQELKSELERERTKTDALQDQMTGMNSQLRSVDLLQRNLTSLVDNQKQQLNETLTYGFDDISKKMRILENSSLEFRKDCANFTSVSRIEEKLSNLEKSKKEDIETFESEARLRLKRLEEKSDDVKQTLKNHSTQLSTMNQQLLLLLKDFCIDEPPSIRNGKPVDLDRSHESIVRYECEPNFFMSRNSTVRCNSGKWEGQPPVCRFFDTSFTMVVYRSENITCYSAENYQKIEFLRVLNTGTGEDLPRNSSKTFREYSAVLDLTRVHNNSERYGVFSCGFAAHESSAVIVVPLDRGYYYYFKELTKIASPGDTVELVMQEYARYFQSIWLHNGSHVQSWDGMRKVTIQNVRPEHAGIYQYYNDKSGQIYSGLLRLIVRKCGKDLYGDNCDLKCPSCYNGGVCEDRVGICICPPGFVGDNCEVACAEGRFSKDCKDVCTKSSCTEHLFCMPDPYGCSCAPGWNGLRCLEGCDKGWYGASCKQPCHCADGPESCNRFSGACSGGCSPGWTGQSCQIQDHDPSAGFFRLSPDGALTVDF